jgi:hypothetical protein
MSFQCFHQCYWLINHWVQIWWINFFLNRMAVIRIMVIKPWSGGSWRRLLLFISVGLLYWIIMAIPGPVTPVLFLCFPITSVMLLDLLSTLSYLEWGIFATCCWLATTSDILMSFIFSLRRRGCHSPESKVGGGIGTLTLHICHFCR